MLVAWFDEQGLRGTDVVKGYEVGCPSTPLVADSEEDAVVPQCRD